MTAQPATYPRHRFPAGIISHAVWLYHVFSLSLRDVELILAERGGDPRKHPALGLEVRCRIRRKTATTAASARGHLAPRRSVHPHPGRAALPVARRRSAWC